MRAGTMRDRITLQCWSDTTDPQWGPGGGWTDYATVWASVAAVAGLEKFQGQAVATEVTHMIRMRYTPDLTNKHRILYRTSKLDIASVLDPDGRRRELVVQAIEHPVEGGADV